MAWLVRRFLRFLLLPTPHYRIHPIRTIRTYVCPCIMYVCMYVLYRNPYSVQIITKTPNSDLSYLYYPLPLDS
jgi:hypothetical protein